MDANLDQELKDLQELYDYGIEWLKRIEKATNQHEEEIGRLKSVEHTFLEARQEAEKLVQIMNNLPDVAGGKNGQ